MRYVVLGAGGFVGKNLVKFLSDNGAEVIGFDRKGIDYALPLTFTNFRLEEGDIVIDCISRIDGNASEIRDVNVVGFEKFIGYLQSQNRNYSYIYFSTYSTLLERYVKSSPYVSSKYHAEALLRERVGQYKILRLIFPFGRGENKNRLLSRLITRFKLREHISIDRLTLNLTPITQILTNFDRILQHPSKEVNFSNDIAFFLPDVASFITNKLGIQGGYSVGNEENRICLDSTIKIDATEEEVWKEIASMTYEP